MPALGEPKSSWEDTTCINNMTSIWVGSKGWQNFLRDEAKAGKFPISIQLLEAQQIHVAMSGALGLTGGKI